MVLKLAQDPLSVSNGREITRRSRQHPFEELTVGVKPVPTDFEKPIGVDEFGEEQIIEEMLWLPGRSAGVHRVDLAIDFTGARATEKGEIEEMGQTFRVRIDITGWCEKIREWESLQFALVSLPPEPPVREDE
jgi:hypothetical protein